ncbi:hypothetical protein LEP1GSC161_3356 [Leptospira santarosai str. CBC1416]|uniref:Uncharacterized protein n=1 Tax=Leptospira santarosai str. CBC1416 TaxID=1193059 RepID=M6VSN6_9LEPT|nr:hypothetical protein LEP1GSC161_3356 [Leptospira santarosai str. CBC1416]
MIHFVRRYKIVLVLLAVLSSGYFGYKKFFFKKPEEKNKPYSIRTNSPYPKKY